MMDESIYATVAAKLHLDEKAVKRAYLYFWRFIKEHISELPLENGVSEDELKQLKTCFGVPQLGKFDLVYNHSLKGYYNNRLKDGKYKEMQTTAEPCDNNSR